MFPLSLPSQKKKTHHGNKEMQFKNSLEKVDTPGTTFRYPLWMGFCLWKVKYSLLLASLSKDLTVKT